MKRLTRRLSFVHSRATGKPYLDGARGRFDRETEDALKAFQREHGLVDDGTFGRLSADKLRKAVEREKQRREQPWRRDARQEAAREPARQDLASLVERALRADRRHDAALEDLLEYGLGRRRQLKQLEAKAHSPEALLSEIVAILLRIEDDVEELEDEEQAPVTPDGGRCPRRARRRGAGDGRGARGGPPAAGGRPRPATVTQVEPPPPSAPEGPGRRA